MSAAENLAVVTAYAERWQAGDFANLFALYGDDFTLHYGGAHRLSGTHAGKDAALTAMAAFTAATGRKLEAVIDVMAGAARAGLVVRESVAAGEGARVIERVFLYRIDGGLMRECWLYDAEQALIDRLVGT